MIRRAEPADLDQIIGIAERWPQHFTPVGIQALLSDAAQLRTLVAVENGEIVGFVVWLATGFEAELLWLACDPKRTRKKVGSLLVEAVCSTLSTQKIVYAKTASESSRRAGTSLDGAAFQAVKAFFLSMGFRLAGVLTAFWGPQEDAEVYIRSVSSSKEYE